MLGVLKNVFRLEKNKYVLWKYIQDIVGNDYFFEVFEKQNGNYGINYKQLDSLIAKSNASIRDFRNFK